MENTSFQTLIGCFDWLSEEEYSSLINKKIAKNLLPTNGNDNNKLLHESIYNNCVNEFGETYQQIHKNDSINHHLIKLSSPPFKFEMKSKRDTIFLLPYNLLPIRTTNNEEKNASKQLNEYDSLIKYLMNNFHFQLSSLVNFEDVLLKYLLELSTSITLTKSNVINWWISKIENQLNLPELWPLSTPGDGNCLLHATCIYISGVPDHRPLLRYCLYNSLSSLKSNYTSSSLYRRWKYEQMKLNAQIHLIFNEKEWKNEWYNMIELANCDPKRINNSESQNFNSNNMKKKNEKMMSSNSINNNALQQSTSTGSSYDNSESLNSTTKRVDQLRQENHRMEPFGRCHQELIRSSDNISNESTYYFDSLEEIHIFVLAQLLYRPIILLSEKMLKDSTGQPLSPINFSGIYLPLMQNPNHCHRTPVILAYDASHFSPLIPVVRLEDDAHSHLNLIPLTDGKDLLKIHFVCDPFSYNKTRNDIESEQIKTKLLPKFSNTSSSSRENGKSNNSRFPFKESQIWQEIEKFYAADDKPTERSVYIPEELSLNDQYQLLSTYMDIYLVDFDLKSRISLKQGHRFYDCETNPLILNPQRFISELKLSNPSLFLTDYAQPSSESLRRQEKYKGKDGRSKKKNFLKDILKIKPSNFLSNNKKIINIENHKTTERQEKTVTENLINDSVRSIQFNDMNDNILKVAQDHFQLCAKTSEILPDKYTDLIAQHFESIVNVYNGKRRNEEMLVEQNKLNDNPPTYDEFVNQNKSNVENISHNNKGGSRKGLEETEKRSDNNTNFNSSNNLMENFEKVTDNRPNSHNIMEAHRISNNFIENRRTTQNESEDHHYCEKLINNHQNRPIKIESHSNLISNGNHQNMIGVYQNRRPNVENIHSNCRNINGNQQSLNDEHLKQIKYDLDKKKLGEYRHRMIETRSNLSGNFPNQISSTNNEEKFNKNEELNNLKYKEFPLNPSTTFRENTEITVRPTRTKYVEENSDISNYNKSFLSNDKMKNQLKIREKDLISDERIPIEIPQVTSFRIEPKETMRKIPYMDDYRDVEKMEIGPFNSRKQEKRNNFQTTPMKTYNDKFMRRLDNSPSQPTFDSTTKHKTKSYFLQSQYGYDEKSERF